MVERKDIKFAFDMKKIPEFLYHGTDCKNIDSICEKGILVGSEKTCNPYSKQTFMVESYVSDCVGNVSMAVDEKDAIFFIVANAQTREDHLKPQCLLKIRTDRINTNKLIFRDLFGKRLKEAKLFDDVPPEAIEHIHIRKFVEKNNKLDVVDDYKRCPIIK